MRRKRRTSTFKQAPNTPYVTFQPQAYQGVQRGINMIADVVRPTLGPVPRIVAVEPVEPGNNKRPELLDNGGLIARRILQLPDRDADMGAMFLRNVLWRQHERAGDGTATTAVIFQSIYNQGIKYIAAGGNAMRLRIYLERGLRAILDEHQSLAQALNSREQIADVARAFCHEDALANMLAEILDTVSEHGPVDIRSGRTQGLARQYVLGTYFKGKPLSEWMLANSPNRRVELNEAAIVVSDLALNEPGDLVPLLHLIDDTGISSLLIVAREMSEQVIATILAAGRVERPCHIIAVKAPDVVTGQAMMLDDLALLTGARPLLNAAGDTIRKVKIDDLGHARRVWSDDEFFGIISGQGDPNMIRRHVASLRAAFEHEDDPDLRTKLRQRIGKLLGGTAVLWIGGNGGIDIKARKELAEQTLAAVRATVGKGIVPGGGASLLACRERLRALAAQTNDIDEAMAYRILIRALEEPTRTILHNAGYDPSHVMGDINRASCGYGFDVVSGQVVDMTAAGIVDSAGVLHTALHTAIASAALALTIDVLVHTRLPDLSFEP